MIYTCIYRGYAQEGSEAWKSIIFPYPITVGIVEGKRLLIYVVSSNASNLMMCFKRNFDIRSQVQYNLVACMHACMGRAIALPSCACNPISISMAISTKKM